MTYVKHTILVVLVEDYGYLVAKCPNEVHLRYYLTFTRTSFVS